MINEKLFINKNIILLLMIIIIIIIFTIIRCIQWLLINEQSSASILSDNEIKFFRLTEKSTIPAFIKYSHKHKLNISDQQIINIGNNPLMLLKIVFLKIFYLRPRPNNMLAKNLNAYAFGPSYPSGHAYQAKYIALELSKLFPKYKKALYKVFEKCANIRVKSGVHYKSDII